MYPRAKYQENKPWENIKDPVASLKHDGASFFIPVSNDGSLRFFSRRQGVKGDFPERTLQLPHLTQNKTPSFAGSVFNVELIHTGHSPIGGKEDHPALSGILNSLPEKSKSTQDKVGPVRAVLLDVVHPKLNTYGEKLQYMKAFEEAYGKPDVLQAASVKIGKNAIQDLIDSSRQMGKEGVIVTSLTAPEDSNTRFKIKHKNTWNLKVSKINQEFDTQGNPKNSMGSLTVVDATGKEVANVGTGFSRELRRSIWKNRKSWVGREIQVEGRTPHRNRIIAPVYNGDSDGQMDKIASSLEDKLIENLVKQYKDKGVNFQKILDNPLFQQLPLDKKVSFIEQMGMHAPAPKMNTSNIASGALGGGVAGVVASAMHQFTTGGIAKGTMIPALAFGALGGAAIGGIGGTLRAILDKNRDMKTHELARSSSGLDALINRSGSSPISKSPFGGNRYLDKFEGIVDSGLPQYANIASEMGVNMGRTQ